MFNFNLKECLAVLLTVLTTGAFSLKGPTLPPHFRAKVRFVLPMLGNLQGELFYASADRWFFCTSPNMIATGNVFGTFERDNDEGANDGSANSETKRLERLV